MDIKNISGLDALFGRIILGMGYVTAEQLRESIEEQKRIRKRGLPAGEDSVPRLGEIMLGKGIITMAQRDEALTMQEAMLANRRKRKKSSLGDMLLGQIAVREGFMGKKQLERCVAIQTDEARKGKYRRLGKIMLDLGYLRTDDLKAILKLQNRTLMECVSCGTKFNVEGYKERKDFLCSRCGSSLRLCKDSEYAVADETLIFELLKELDERLS